MKKCIKCGAELEMDSLFCTNCGVKQPTLKRCAKCGAYIAEDSNFCTECGARQIEEKQVIAPITEETSVEVDNTTQEEQDFVQEVVVAVEEEQKTTELEDDVVEEEEVSVGNEEVPVEKEEKSVEEASAIKKNDNSGKGIMAAIITITAIVMAGIIAYVIYLMKYDGSETAISEEVVDTTEVVAEETKQDEDKYKGWEGKFFWECDEDNGYPASMTYVFEFKRDNKDNFIGEMTESYVTRQWGKEIKAKIIGILSDDVLTIKQVEGVVNPETMSEEPLPTEDLKTYKIVKRDGKYYCKLKDTEDNLAERKLEHLFIPPFADIFTFYLKRHWKEVKKDYMAYMESRGEELVFDGVYNEEEEDLYEEDEGDLGVNTYSKLIYGANISFDEEKHSTQITTFPFFGVEFSTWCNDLDLLDDIRFYFDDENDYKQYVKQIYAYGFKDEEYGACMFYYDDTCVGMIHGRDDNGQGYYIWITPNIN